MYSGTLCEVEPAERCLAILSSLYESLTVAVPKPGIEPSPIAAFIPDPHRSATGIRFTLVATVPSRVCSKEIRPCTRRRQGICGMPRPVMETDLETLVEVRHLKTHFPILKGLFNDPRARCGLSMTSIQHQARTVDGPGW